MRIFLTGRPGCGKSTVVRKVIEKLKGKIAGIITPEIRKSGVRTGFKIIDLKTGKEEVLASVDIKGPRVSKYGVNINGIDLIVDEFMKSLEEAEVVILDELGRMEFFSAKFKAAVQKILASDKPLLATLHRTLVKDFEKHGKIIFVDMNNREKLPEKILRELKKI
jgi:nucleoside-triphosphatase